MFIFWQSLSRVSMYFYNNIFSTVIFALSQFRYQSSSIILRFLFNSAKALLGDPFLGTHFFLSCKRVAPYIHLPAWDAVNNSSVSMASLAPIISAHRQHERRLRLHRGTIVSFIQLDLQEETIARNLIMGILHCSSPLI